MCSEQLLLFVGVASALSSELQWLLVMLDQHPKLCDVALAHATQQAWILLCGETSPFFTRGVCECIVCHMSVSKACLPACQPTLI